MGRKWQVPNWLGSSWLWVIVAFLLRLAYVLLDARHTALFAYPLLDEAEVVEAAEALLYGDGFGPEPLFRAPGYSIYLAAVMLVGGDGWPILARIIQALMGGVLAGAACSVARGLVGPGRSRALAGAFAGFLVAVHGPAVRLESTLSPDGPAAAAFGILLAGAVALARILGTGAGRRANLKSRENWAVVQWELVQKLGLGVGVAVMVMAFLRPTVVPVAALLVGMLGWLTFRTLKHRGKAIILGALIAGPLMVAGAGLTIRNGMASGEWRMMPTQGMFNLREANRLDGPRGRYLAQRTIPEVPIARDGREHPLMAAIRKRPSANPTREMAVREFVAAQMESLPTAPAGQTFSAMDSWHGQLLWQSLMRDPLGHIGLYLQKVLELASDREIFNYEDYEVQRDRSPTLSLLAGRMGILLPLGILAQGLLFAGMIGRIRMGGRGWFGGPGIREHLAAVIVGFMLFSMVLVIALGYSSGRMRMPLVAPLAGLAGTVPVLVGRIIMDWARGRVSTVFVFGGLLPGLLALVAAWQDMTGVRSESTAYHDLGRMSNAAWHHGQKLESEAINPADDTRLRAQDRYTEALILARQAREQAPPLYPIPYRLEAQALSALGRGRAALAAWQRSAELLPADGSVHQNLGTTLLYDLNDPAASIGAYTRAVELGSLESRAFLALARLRLGQINQAKEALEPFREVLNALASNPLTPSARRPALPIPTRAVVAASLLARREGHLERANALASYLGPKGSALLEEEWSRLTTPSGNRDTQKLP